MWMILRRTLKSQIKSQRRQAVGDSQQRQAANVPGQSRIERSQATPSFRPGFADTAVPIPPVYAVLAPHQAPFSGSRTGSQQSPASGSFGLPEAMRAIENPRSGHIRRYLAAHSGSFASRGSGVQIPSAPRRSEASCDLVTGLSVGLYSTE